MAGTLAGMGKKKKKQPVVKEVLYLEVDPRLKRELERLAELHLRSVTGEATLALRRYVAEQNEAEGLPPLEEGGRG
jgi:hypothetical protein